MGCLDLCASTLRAVLRRGEVESPFGAQRSPGQRLTGVGADPDGPPAGADRCAEEGAADPARHFLLRRLVCRCHAESSIPMEAPPSVGPIGPSPRDPLLQRGFDLDRGCSGPSAGRARPCGSDGNGHGVVDDAVHGTQGGRTNRVSDREQGMVRPSELHLRLGGRSDRPPVGILGGRRSAGALAPAQLRGDLGASRLRLSTATRVSFAGTGSIWSIRPARRRRPPVCRRRPGRGQRPDPPTTTPPSHSGEARP